MTSGKLQRTAHLQLAAHGTRTTSMYVYSIQHAARSTQRNFFFQRTTHAAGMSMPVPRVDS
jgi:hypothetical protein